jgi:hypothetical protein
LGYEDFVNAIRVSDFDSNSVINGCAFYLVSVELYSVWDGVKQQHRLLGRVGARLIVHVFCHGEGIR